MPTAHERSQLPEQLDKLLKERLDGLLEQWPRWGLVQKPILVRQLHGGLNNTVFLIQSVKDFYVLKVFNKPLPNNFESQNLAAQNGVAPAVLYSHPDGDYSVMSYLDTPASQTTSPKLLAHSLAAVHNIEAPHSARFNYVEFCDTYRSKLNTSLNPDFKQRYESKHKLLQPALKAFTSDSTNYCFSHNDLVLENCFLMGGKMLFIDWDYAALNNPWFDLASLAFYFDLSTSQTKELLIAYWQIRTEEAAKTDFSQQLSCALCAVIWMDILWFAERSIRLDLPLDKLTEKAKFRALDRALETFRCESSG